MRIQALSSHTLKSASNVNFKQKSRSLRYPEYNSRDIYARKAAALCGEYEDLVNSEQKPASASYCEHKNSDIYAKKAAALCGEYY